MQIEERIPDLSDKELENLHANAVRLAQSGSVKQRQQAEELLPLLGAEMEARVRAREEERASKGRASAKRRAVIGAGRKDAADEGE